MKKKFRFTLIFTAFMLVFSCLVFAACAAGDAITVITREGGSGTRGAFIELTGVEVKKSDGTKTDNTYIGAVVQSSTAAVLTGVAGDKKAIGYISLGSLNDTVKALSVEGTTPTVGNVKNGSYKLSRPFYVAVRTGTVNSLSEDFIKFILGKAGQDIVSEKGYVNAVENAAEFQSALPKGTIKVGGSSSVTPVMEKLKEAYETVNTGASIEIHTTDSSTGLNTVAEGTVDIAMASRELKSSEKAVLTGTKIALDGIAVIVNKDNSLSDITVEALRAVYTGEKRNWSELSAESSK